MAEGKELEEIKEALRQKRLYVMTETGFQREITARCPKDSGSASVRTIYTARGASGPEITSVSFRCNVCGNVFVAEAEDMVLR